MQPTGRELKQLQAALVSAFPSQSELAQMVLFGMNENLNTISQSTNLREMVFDLIQWAQAKGRTQELVRAALEANATNPELQQLAMGQGAVAPPIPDPAQDTPAGSASSRLHDATAAQLETAQTGETAKATPGRVWPWRNYVGWGLLLISLSYPIVSTVVMLQSALIYGGGHLFIENQVALLNVWLISIPVMGLALYLLITEKRGKRRD
jgi:Effector-associated domain 1